MKEWLKPLSDKQLVALLNHWEQMTQYYYGSNSYFVKKYGLWPRHSMQTACSAARQEIYRRGIAMVSVT